MNAHQLTARENTQRREDMLRELNLYPLWQRRVPGTRDAVPAAAAEIAEVSTVTEQQSSMTLSGERVPEQPAPVLLSPPDSGTWSWFELKKQVKNCTACSLRAGCTQTVFGMGDEKADWLLVGSWPTEDDDRQGQPFSGQAGQLLDNMLAAIGLKRGANVYLTNVVKCTGSISRGPQAAQIERCAPYLARQIQLLQPRLIVALGHAAATALLGEDRAWDSLLGKIHQYRGNEKMQPQAPIPLIITHHPAALLLTPQNKAQAWKDLCLARNFMQEKVAAV